MVLHITCDEVVAHGGSASLNNAQGQTTKKLLAYTTYTTQPKITKKRIKLRKSKKKSPFPYKPTPSSFFPNFLPHPNFLFFYFLFFPGCGIFLFFTHLEHKLIKRRAPVFLHGKLGASRVMNK